MTHAAESRQPIHTFYGGAHLFASDAAQKLGAIALKALHDHAPDADALGSAFQLPPVLARRIHPRVVDKLTREPVEDFRIDFEDGFGNRSDDEEDRAARSAGEEVAKGMEGRTLPAGVGIRVKNLGPEFARRSLRTFELFLSHLLKQSRGKLPDNFVVTVPKITAPADVAAMASACEAFERAHDLAPDSLKIELMIETTQSVIAADGTVALPRLVAEGRGRVVAAHFGTYDYTAACGITAAHQHMLHPACDFAKSIMQVALAGTPIRLSDGATNVMPVGPHRAPAAGALTADQRAENTTVVHRAWRLHAEHTRHSLVTGFYQGWDLHPAQLPARYVTVYAFFLEGLEAASERLRNFVQKAAQATLVSDVFDDAATGQGLLNYFLRALNCGAVTEAEALQLSGLTLDELRGKSFLRILENRRR
jgi:citrate lyase beta subunit